MYDLNQYHTRMISEVCPCSVPLTGSELVPVVAFMRNVYPHKIVYLLPIARGKSSFSPQAWCQLMHQDQ